jgi:hypothetical protein
MLWQLQQELRMEEQTVTRQRWQLMWSLMRAMAKAAVVFAHLWHRHRLPLVQLLQSPPLVVVREPAAVAYCPHRQPLRDSAQQQKRNRRGQR